MGNARHLAELPNFNDLGQLGCDIRKHSLLLGRCEEFGDFDRSNASQTPGAEDVLVVTVGSVELEVFDCAESRGAQEFFDRAGKTVSSYFGFFKPKMSKLIEQSLVGGDKGHNGPVREERKYVKEKDPGSKLRGMHCIFFCLIVAGSRLILEDTMSETV